MLHTKRFVGGLLVAATLTSTGIMTAHALGNIGRPATASTRAVRVDPPRAGPAVTDVSAIVGLINAARGRAALAPVAWHTQVAAAALTHSTDMAAIDRMTHSGSDGSDAGDRLLHAGFAWGAWGENVAVGYASVQSVFDAWMASPGHRAQILGNFAFVGGAVVASSTGRTYWTLDFAR